MLATSLCCTLLCGARLRAPSPCLCTTEPPSFRQRLREVAVDPALLREVNTVVGHRNMIRGRQQNIPDAVAARAGLPLHNPYGTRPRFIAAAATASSLPPEGVPEVAFIGRSNVGKSSLLNALTGCSSLAKVSDKPGKTQTLNFFEAGRKDACFRLVDMPGYGFALASDAAVERWRDLSAQYLRERKGLKLVLVLLDAKVGLKPSDLQMLQFLEAERVKYTLVMTKADAAGNPQRAAQLTALTLASVKRAKKFARPASLVSSRTGAGVGWLQRRIIEAATGNDPMAHVDGGWLQAASGRVGRGANAGGRGANAGGRGAAVMGRRNAGRGDSGSSRGGRGGGSMGGSTVGRGRGGSRGRRR